LPVLDDEVRQGLIESEIVKLVQNMFLFKLRQCAPTLDARPRLVWQLGQQSSALGNAQPALGLGVPASSRP
jgi:hypothetical protein